MQGRVFFFSQFPATTKAVDQKLSSDQGGLIKAYCENIDDLQNVMEAKFI